jgi:hypothetical protein
MALCAELALEVSTAQSKDLLFDDNSLPALLKQYFVLSNHYRT